jgi:cardiolipin synthase
MPDVFQIDGNELALLQNGAAYFPALCDDIDAAKRLVSLETYIFAADQAGMAVRDALLRAARRGVIVRVLLDGFGAADFPKRWLDEFKTAGVQVHFFRRELYRFKLRRHRLRRMHRKLIVIDGELAYIGGINIIDDGAEPRFDFAVRLDGTVAVEIHDVMRRMWNAVVWASGKRMVRDVGPGGASGTRVVVVLRDNLRHRRDIERAYLKQIRAAQHEVVIANAYFLPGRIFRRTMIQAARRGVRVVLLLQGRIEHRLLHYATRALYAQLLVAGIEIYEYQPGFLHAKVAVIDGAWATVGSSNIDPFSLMLAREANLMVSDAAFARCLRDKLMYAVAHAAVRIEADRAPGWGNHLLVRLSYATVRMVIGLLGYGKSVI